MNFYNISYDLNTPGQKYKEVYEAIKKAFPLNCHPLESTWLIQTNTPTVKEVWNKISYAFDRNDKVVIANIYPNEIGWIGLDPNSDKWLHTKMII